MTDLLSRDQTLTPVLPPPSPAVPAMLPSPAPETVLEALEWLGGTVEEVAEGLRARGIKGRPSTPRSCPLALYLQEWFPDARASYMVIYHETDATNFFTTPIHLDKFMVAFDSHEFPDLIAD